MATVEITTGRALATRVANVINESKRSSSFGASDKILFTRSENKAGFKDMTAVSTNMAAFDLIFSNPEFCPWVS